MKKISDIEQARAMSGLRIVTITNVPSPWGEALRGFVRIKGLDHTAVRIAPGLPLDALQAWTAQASFPVAAWNDERPRSQWNDQLYLVERLKPAPALIPSRVEDRILMFGLSNEICGENGFGWARRLMMIHPALSSGQKSAFAEYLGPKYGYSREAAEAAPVRVASIMNALSAQLAKQKRADSRFFIGGSISALDVYWATFAALVKPLANELCPMSPGFRASYTTDDPTVVAAMNPILFEHRDFIYREYLELPVDLS